MASPSHSARAWRPRASASRWSRAPVRSFAHRSLEDEMMDGADVPYDVFAGCLADLAKVNAATLARPPTLSWLARATRDLPRGATVSVLDVGYGQGDMLRAIHRWAVRA